MDPAKIQLSQEELLLVQNAEWLLTKNRIIEKVYVMFGSLITDVERLLSEQSLMWPEVLTVSPKIFKGENYKGLPYVMLDYPRCFGKHDTFAIRTMFWWGNFFSVTLHLKGLYKRELAPLLKIRQSSFVDNQLYVGINSDEWRHDFEPDNYVQFSEADMQTRDMNIINKDFCKISGKIQLNEWNTAPVKLLQLYRIILEGIKVNSPGDGTGL
jgi:hypothetical protein